MPQNMSAQGRGGGHSGRPPQTSSRYDTRQSSVIDISKIVFGAKIDPKLYSDIAEAAAKDVGTGSSREQNNPSQLRRFYDELVMLQTKVGTSDERFERYLPFVQMLKAKVAYARGRNKVDDKFAFLLRRVVDQATDHGTLKQARLFMEAFMAFYKVYGKE
jgi:CRISPR-associated protein Csm2